VAGRAQPQPARHRRLAPRSSAAAGISPARQAGLHRARNASTPTPHDHGTWSAIFTGGVP
jgi:hypothetical protein